MRVLPQAIRIIVPVRVGKLQGLGDVVALGAEPVKHVIQRILPGWNCGGCDKRKEWLNDRVKFSKR